MYLHRANKESNTSTEINGPKGPQVAIDIGAWQLAKDKDGQIEHPVRITQRDGDAEVEESPADLSTDTAESADERNESNEAGDGSAEKKNNAENWRCKKLEAEKGR